MRVSDTYAGAQAPAREKQFGPVSFAKKKKKRGAHANAVATTYYEDE